MKNIRLYQKPEKSVRVAAKPCNTSDSGVTTVLVQTLWLEQKL